MPVAVGGARELAPDFLRGGGKNPVLERRAVPQGAGLARQNRHIMPGVVSRLFAAEAAAVFANDNPVLPDNDAVGVGVEFDRTPDRARLHRVFIVVEANQAGLRHRYAHRMEAVEAATQRHDFGPLFLESLEDRLIGNLGMTMRFGVGDAFVEQLAACRTDVWGFAARLDCRLSRLFCV